MAMSRIVEDPIRVWQVVETMDTGGAEYIVAELVNSLDDGFDVTVCCVQHSGAAAARIARKGVKIVELGKKEGNDYRVPFILADLFRKNRAEVVHSHDWGVYCESVVGATLAGVPAVIHTAHGDYPPHSGGTRGKWKDRTRRLTERGLSRWSSAIVTVSHDVKNVVAAKTGIAREAIRVVHNGIRPRVPEDQKVQRIREEIGLSPFDFVIVFVGRLSPVKNIPLIFRAAALLLLEMPDLKVLVVGDGPEHASLSVMIDTIGIRDRVTMLGERNDVAECLALGNLFVLPSWHEGISLALLEAMAARLPVVATAVGGTPEVLVADETGVLIDPERPDTLADAVRLLRGNPEMMRRLAEAGYERVSREFHLDGMARKYESIYREFIPARLD